MKNNYYKIAVLVFLLLPAYLFAQSKKTAGEFYQVTVYHFKTAEQQKVIDNYLEKAYLPALHRQKIKSVGVFIPISNDTAADKRLYVVVPLASLNDAATIAAQLDQDNDYRTNGNEYLQTSYDKPVYTRMENILLKSFPLAPSMILPKLKSAANERVYELRSYESTSETIFHNKVKMFNEGGEIALFKRLNFNAIFYASVIAGCQMPNLMYMTSFENMADRNEHWKTFGADPEWKTTSALPEYQHNVSKIEIFLMKAAPYSDY